MCTDTECNNEVHRSSTDKLLVYNELVLCMSYASEQCIPRKSKSKHKEMPDWKTTVAPLRQKALFRRNIWHECGSHSTGVTADIMRLKIS